MQAETNESHSSFWALIKSPHTDEQVTPPESSNPREQDEHSPLASVELKLKHSSQFTSGHQYTTIENSVS